MFSLNIDVSAVLLINTLVVVTPLIRDVSVRYPVVLVVFTGKVAQLIVLPLVSNVAGVVAITLFLNVLYIKLFKFCFFKYSGSTLLTTSVAVLFSLIVNFSELLLMSAYITPSSAYDSMLWKVPVGSVISIYLLCPACVLLVALNLLMFVDLLLI